MKTLSFLFLGILLSLNIMASDTTGFRKIPLNKSGAYVSAVLVPIVYTKELGCINSKAYVICRYVTYLDSPTEVLFKKQYKTSLEAREIAEDAQNEISVARAQGDSKILFGNDAKGNPVFKLVNN